MPLPHTPPLKQLHPGTAVSIVQKPDQRSGKLSHGTIAQILTRGDHPRGVKVRLTSGEVGRVRSLVAAGADRDGDRKFKMQGDVRRDEYSVPSQAASLMDYVRFPASSKSSSSKSSMVPGAAAGGAMTAGEEVNGNGEGMDVQKRLEKEFPSVDSALVAAILGDYLDVEEARRVIGMLKS